MIRRRILMTDEPIPLSYANLAIGREQKDNAAERAGRCGRPAAGGLRQNARQTPGCTAEFPSPPQGGSPSCAGTVRDADERVAGQERRLASDRSLKAEGTQRRVMMSDGGAKPSAAGSPPAPRLLVHREIAKRFQITTRLPRRVFVLSADSRVRRFPLRGIQLYPPR
jgi:hypothetical protein